MNRDGEDFGRSQPDSQTDRRRKTNKREREGRCMPRHGQGTSASHGQGVQNKTPKSVTQQQQRQNLSENRAGSSGLYIQPRTGLHTQTPLSMHIYTPHTAPDKQQGRHMLVIAYV